MQVSCTYHTGKALTGYRKSMQVSIGQTWTWRGEGELDMDASFLLQFMFIWLLLRRLEHSSDHCVELMLSRAGTHELRLTAGLYALNAR